MACRTGYHSVPEAVGVLRISSSPEAVCKPLPFTRHTHEYSKVPPGLNVALQLRRASGYSVSLCGNGCCREESRSPGKLPTLQLKQKRELRPHGSCCTPTLLRGKSGCSFEARPHLEFPLSYTTGQDEL